MAHDRNEEHEESEYHFSDDEVSYEVDTEPAKTTPVSASKKNILTQLSGSRRLVLSIVVFVVLVIVVYKILLPTPAPVGEIVPASPVAEGPRPVVVNKKPIQMAPPAVMPVQAPPVQVVTTTRPGQVSTVSVQGNLPGAAMSNTVPQAVNEAAAITGIEARMSAMAAENEKRISQLNADYTQKLNDYAAQNKQLQDQVQLLTAKMGSMETQISQLMQVLMRQGTANNPAEANHINTSITGESKVPYNVQAIIPGRAWLKSENGDTVTVAEGDMIKGLGRVTKIDPYDGVVEVNTGNKALSLSYGSGG